jgi:hypothetical protein
MPLPLAPTSEVQGPLCSRVVDVRPVHSVRLSFPSPSTADRSTSLGVVLSRPCATEQCLHDRALVLTSCLARRGKLQQLIRLPYRSRLGHFAAVQQCVHVSRPMLFRVTSPSFVDIALATRGHVSANSYSSTTRTTSPPLLRPQRISTIPCTHGWTRGRSLLALL